MDGRGASNLMSVLVAQGLCCVLSVHAGRPTGWTAGGRSVLILPVGFTDQSAPAPPPGGWADVMNAVSNFYLRSSYSNCWVSGFAVAPAIAMGVSSTNYRPFSDWKTTAFLPDVRARAKLAGFDSDDYDIEIIQTRITNEAPTGTAVHGGKGIWLNYTNGYALFALATAHEMGHNLGLFHTRGYAHATVFHPAKEDYYWEEYGGMFDIMGSGTTNPLADFCAYNKNWLGWLPDTQVVRPATSGTFRIHAIDQGVCAPGTFLALRLAHDASNSFWFEFRQAVSNNPWAMSGLVVHSGGEEVLASGGSPMQLDMTPGSHGFHDADPRRLPGAALLDGTLLLGRTFSDTTAGLHVTPVAKGGTNPESLDVVVNLGIFPSNRPPVAAITATNVSPAANQPVHFSVAASDPDGDPLAYSWEFDDAGAAGGAGVVPFGSGGVPADATLATDAGHAWAGSGVFFARCTVTDMKGGRTIVAAGVTVGDGSELAISGTVRDENGQPLAGAVVNNWRVGPLNAQHGTTNLVASGETASNGQYRIRVRSNMTYRLIARHNGRSFVCTMPGGSETGVVSNVTASVANVDFTRVSNTYTIGGTVYLAGIGRTYRPAIDGPLVVSDGIPAHDALVDTSGNWRMTVPEGPLALSFAAASNHVIRHGFPNPLVVSDACTLLALFADIPGQVSTLGFAEEFASGDESSGSVPIPVVLRPPASWTNGTWPPNAWLGGLVSAESTARYGVDYRLLGTEIVFTNNTAVFTNNITLRVIPGGATNSRTVVLNLGAFNFGANIGPASNHTFAIVPPAADADGDGLPDAWEWRFTHSFTNLSPSGDDDNDGANNRDEYVADTEPLNARSRLAITNVLPQPGGLLVYWNGGSNAVQFIEEAAELSAAWTVLFTNPPPTAPGPVALVNATNPTRLIRIRAQR